MNIQNNLAYIDDQINHQPPPSVDAYNQVIEGNTGEGAIKSQPPAHSLKNTIGEMLT